MLCRWNGASAATQHALIEPKLQRMSGRYSRLPTCKTLCEKTTAYACIRLRMIEEICNRRGLPKNTITLFFNITTSWVIKHEMVLVLYVLKRMAYLTQPVLPFGVHPSCCVDMQTIASNS